MKPHSDGRHDWRKAQIEEHKPGVDKNEDRRCYSFLKCNILLFIFVKFCNISKIAQLDSIMMYLSLLT